MVVLDTDRQTNTVNVKRL